MLAASVARKEKQQSCHFFIERRRCRTFATAAGRLQARLDRAR
jgi:hypothetical protein